MGDDPPATATVEFDPDRAAVVLVEFQRQWTDPGLYNRLVRRSVNERNVVERTRKTVRNAREAGMSIVHAPLRIDPDVRRGWLATLTFGRVFTEGTEKAEFTPGLYEDGDPVVEGRYNFDAFDGSDLEAILEANDVETVFVAGFVTDQCVANTMETALAKGYDAYMLSDLTATVHRLLQRRTERRFGNLAVSSESIFGDRAASSQYEDDRTAATR